MKTLKTSLWVVVTVSLFWGCSSSSRILENESFSESIVQADSIVSFFENNRNELEFISGTGRALVSQPGSSDRVTIDFFSNRNTSLIKIRSSGGIAGGEVLIDQDSLLIYNSVDKTAEKVSLMESNLSSIGSIASVNILNLFYFKIFEEDIDNIFENETHFIVLLNNQLLAYISKNSGLIEKLQKTSKSETSFSLVEYEGYAQIKDFYLPRKITILSYDENSQATLLVQRLSVNEPLPELTIDIPDNVHIYRP